MDDQTNENENEICEAIDKLTLRNLELIEEKIDLNLQIESLIRSGHIELAKARYINGKERVSILQVPSNETNITSTFKLESTSRTPTEGVTSFDISLKQDDEIDDEYQDPIKWFGVLVPQNLKTAQKKFQESVYLGVKAINIQLELTQTLDKLKNLYQIKSSKQEDNAL